jgi:hypothetical protein
VRAIPRQEKELTPVDCYAVTSFASWASIPARLSCAVQFGLILGRDSGEIGGGGNAAVIGYVVPRITIEWIRRRIRAAAGYAVVGGVVASDVPKAVTRRLMPWHSGDRVRGVLAHNARISQLGGDRSPGVRIVW